MGQEICIKIMVRINAVYTINTNVHSTTLIHIKHLSNKIINNIAEPSNQFGGTIHVNLQKGLHEFIIHSDSKIQLNDFTIFIGNTPCQISTETFNINNLGDSYGIRSGFGQLNFFTCDVTNDMLNVVDKNIESFTRKIKDYKNILFMCTDGPNYGGAGINCNEIQKFYSNISCASTCNAINTYCIYHTLEKRNNFNPNHCIINVDNLEYILGNLNFVPDLIILKNYVPIDIKKYFSCPVYFCVPGLFTESLNKYYFDLKTKTEHDVYIDQNILKQINMSDKIFCNSGHTKDILYKYYNVKADLFYSGFIDYYKKRINTSNDFYTRKYDYAIVVSNVERQIKNVQASIDFINSQCKTNVIVIGKGSSKYSHFGFECIESLTHDQIYDILKNTRYVVQDSFYESCSNVKIEANFVGCLVINSSTAT